MHFNNKRNQDKKGTLPDEGTGSASPHGHFWKHNQMSTMNLLPNDNIHI